MSGVGVDGDVGRRRCLCVLRKCFGDKSEGFRVRNQLLPGTADDLTLRVTNLLAFQSNW